MLLTKKCVSNFCHISFVHAITLSLFCLLIIVSPIMAQVQRPDSVRKGDGGDIIAPPDGRKRPKFPREGKGIKGETGEKHTNHSSSSGSSKERSKGK